MINAIQRCRGDGLPEDQRSVLHDAGHRACSGGGFTERRMDQWRQIAEQALPVVRNVAGRCATRSSPDRVAPVPLVGRNTLLMLAGYATALISIQLWPPLFAILNYMASIYGQLDQAAAAEVGGGVRALALQTSSPIYSNAVSSQGGGVVPHLRHSDAGLFSGKQARQLRQRDHGWPAGSAIRIPQRECVRRRRHPATRAWAMCLWTSGSSPLDFEPLGFTATGHGRELVDHNRLWSANSLVPAQ